jgi:hypothetical protein
MPAIGLGDFLFGLFLTTSGGKVKNDKMARIMGRLRWERQRRLGDFIRPRELPADVWRRACRTHGTVEAMRLADAGLLR